MRAGRGASRRPGPPVSLPRGGAPSALEALDAVAAADDPLLPVNLFGYGQVESAYGSGQFIRALENGITESENLVRSRIEGREEIYKSIKDFLGKGK
jgi:hypothetical protein